MASAGLAFENYSGFLAFAQSALGKMVPGKWSKILGLSSLDLSKRFALRNFPWVPKKPVVCQSDLSRKSPFRQIRVNWMRYKAGNI